jgi:Zn-finger nucleic acid-binding protein
VSTPSEAARLLAAQRRVVGQRQCPECGATFTATTAGRFKKTYCSMRCAQRAHYRAHREHYNQLQRERRARRRQQQAEQPTEEQK